MSASPSSLFSLDSGPSSASPHSSPPSSRSQPLTSPLSSPRPLPPLDPTPTSLRPPQINGFHLLPALLPQPLQSLLLSQIAQSDLFLGGQRDQVMLFGHEPLAFLKTALEEVKRWGGGVVKEEEQKDVWERCWEKGDFKRQAILNLYKPGRGITPHIDLPNRYASPILSLSLLSGTVFLLRRSRIHEPTSVSQRGQTDRVGWDERRVWLPAGSVVLLDGEARWEWEHGIEPLLADFVEVPVVDALTDGGGREGVEAEEGEGGQRRGTWKGRGTRVSLTLRWLKAGADVVGPSADDGALEQA